MFSALPLKADVAQRGRHVRFLPTSEVGQRHLAHRNDASPAYCTVDPSVNECRLGGITDLGWESSSMSGFQRRLEPLPVISPSRELPLLATIRVHEGVTIGGTHHASTEDFQIN